MPIGRVFRIEHLLSDNARLKAKQKCTALNRDFYNLIGVYDEGVNSGKRTAPNHPDGALLAWIDKYTKGERL